MDIYRFRTRDVREKEVDALWFGSLENLESIIGALKEKTHSTMHQLVTESEGTPYIAFECEVDGDHFTHKFYFNTWMVFWGEDAWSMYGDRNFNQIFEQLTFPEDTQMSAQDKIELSQLFEDTNEYDKDPDRFLKMAKLMVVGSYNSTHDSSVMLIGTDPDEEAQPDELNVDQLYIVWFAKTLKNWKALISTSRPGDGLYFEVTYNGEKLETYVDTYRKEDNQVFSHHDQ